MAEGYTRLKDLRVRIGRSSGSGGDGTEDDDDIFRVCFWVFVSGTTRTPVTVIHQMLDGEDRVPFLVLNEDEKFNFLPPRYMYRETDPSGDSLYWTEGSSISSKPGNYLEKWTHIGYEVTRRYMRLHINGEVSAEVALPFLPTSHLGRKNSNEIILMGNNEYDGKVQGYIYNLQSIPRWFLISDHLSKDSPLQLSVDVLSISGEIEERDDGIWTIVGREASCQREFSLEVNLKDALGRPVHKEIEIVASVVYTDDGKSVEKLHDDAESPLLMQCNEPRFSSPDIPAKLVHGQMPFKLKLSKLPSECENRLFHVHFQSTDTQIFPFLEVYSPTIYCISRKRHTSHCTEQKHSPKRLKPEDDGSPAKVADSMALQQRNDEKPDERSSKQMFEHKSETNGMTSDSESSDVNHSCDGTQDVRTLLSDELIFRYCLEGTVERSMLLREFIASANEKDVVEFANQVSMYAGCSHHRHQIMMTKQLVEEGVDLWNVVSRNNHDILWMDAIPEIKVKFQKISHACRGLSEKDIEVLQTIAGCNDILTRENFEKLWSWLYPVACTLSNEKINKLWECVSPKWIEGLITKEEAENTLRGPIGLQPPGTFILRFPTTRSWPHPDAGNLVVTYVGADSIIHNKLISLRESTCSGTLQDLILEEPGLSQLGQVVTR